MFRDFSYIRSVLMPDEHVLFATSLHWVVYSKGLVTVLLGLAFILGARPVMGLLDNPDLAAQADFPLKILATLVTFIGCSQLLMAVLRQTGTELVVTNRRVVAKFGIVSRTTYELFLSKIEGADVQQTAWGRILGYGTITIRGVGTNLMPINYIDGPDKFQNVLLSQIGATRAAA